MHMHPLSGNDKMPSDHDVRRTSEEILLGVQGSCDGLGVGRRHSTFPALVQHMKAKKDLRASLWPETFQLVKKLMSWMLGWEADEDEWMWPRWLCRNALGGCRRPVACEEEFADVATEIADLSLSERLQMQPGLCHFDLPDVSGARARLVGEEQEVE